MSYADDLALGIANIAEGLKVMMKRYKKYFERKGLELNICKTKFMIFKKAGERNGIEEFFWNRGKR